MYKPPIEVITHMEIQQVLEEAVSQMQTDVDNHIYQCIQKVGVDVDKEELIKALSYDRGQYEKGYADGVKEFAAKLIDMCDSPYWCVWMSDIERAAEEFRSSNAGLFGKGDDG